MIADVIRLNLEVNMNDESHISADDLLRDFLGDDFENEVPEPPLRESNLSEKALLYLGKSIHVLPYEGWGWSVYDTDEWTPVESEPMRAPERIETQILSFFEWNGKRRGGVGRVTEGPKLFHRMWMLFYTYNQVGSYDFDDNLARYWIHLGPEEPSLFPFDHSDVGKYWPLPRFGKCRRYTGMAVLAASLDDAKRELDL